MLLSASAQNTSWEEHCPTFQQSVVPSSDLWVFLAHQTPKVEGNQEHKSKIPELQERVMSQTCGHWERECRQHSDAVMNVTGERGHRSLWLWRLVDRNLHYIQLPTEEREP